MPGADEQSSRAEARREVPRRSRGICILILDGPSSACHPERGRPARSECSESNRAEPKDPRNFPPYEARGQLCGFKLARKLGSR